jgi:hypothetical protein
VTKTDKKNEKIRRNPGNVKFQDFISWLEDNGFSLDRVSGSHHILVHPSIETPVNAKFFQEPFAIFFSNFRTLIFPLT